MRPVWVLLIASPVMVVVSLVSGCASPVGPVALAVVVAVVVRRAVAGRESPLLVIPVVVLPAFGLAATAMYAFDSWQPGWHAVGYAWYFGGLAVAMAVAGLLTRAGWTVWAWIAGVLLMAAAADVAVAQAVSPDDPQLDREYALVWLPAMLLRTSFGLAHPEYMERFILEDIFPFDAGLYITFAGFALAAVIATARRVAEPGTRPEDVILAS
ncbi:hypothetical protein [Dactylosporangium sp. NPDC051541]|uniref:hypothetical protein n=1 Tax=Dactylosporangium sp. NPDC051541 TaxID=3363977 RepID=UPI0037B6AB87